jgi:hypothetical protein
VPSSVAVSWAAASGSGDRPSRRGGQNAPNKPSPPQTPGPAASALFTSWQTLGGKTAGLAVKHFEVTLRLGVSRQAYQAALQRARRITEPASPPQNDYPARENRLQLQIPIGTSNVASQANRPKLAGATALQSVTRPVT